MIYLDNSATTFPKPPEVIRATENALRAYGFNPGRGGYRRSLQTAQKVYEARESVRAFFRAPSVESVIFTSGCTQALNTVIKGTLRQGDHVVISSMEHNAVLRPLHRLKKDGVITFSTARVYPGDDEKTLQSFREAINPRTRMFICTHASNVFGFRLPAERLCALAHSYGLLFCLDAAQSAGLLPVDMTDGYDFVCCAGHKYLYGPMGIGLLLIGNDNAVEPLIEGGTGSVSSEADMPSFYPDRLEAGTLNISGILGLQAGLGFVSRRGIGRIFEKESRLIGMLYQRLGDMRHITVYKRPEALRTDAPVLSFNVEGKDSETVIRFLSEHADIAARGGLHCAPLAHHSVGTQETGCVRISPSVFTTAGDMLTLSETLRKIR